MYFKDDYSIGAHPQVLWEINNANKSLENSYQLDSYSIEASKLIRKKIGNQNALVRFVSGGTLANLLIIAATLKPYHAVISVKSGHINLHETGAVEFTGHKIISIEGKQGKILPEEIMQVLEAHTTPPHMVIPKMVYISNSTELGSIYTKKELQEISSLCKKHQLYLFMDGARLGSALSAEHNDLSLKDLASLTDAFYIGGTKNGGLMGEAIVINNEELQEGFDFHMKQKGALSAKSRFFGSQFIALFKDNLYFELASKANHYAQELAEIWGNYGFKLKYPQETNQVFPILNNTIIAKLKPHMEFYIWEPVDNKNSVIRMVTSWKTTEEEITNFKKLLKEIL